MDPVSLMKKLELYSHKVLNCNIVPQTIKEELEFTKQLISRIWKVSIPNVQGRPEVIFKTRHVTFSSEDGIETTNQKLALLTLTEHLCKIYTLSGNDYIEQRDAYFELWLQFEESIPDLVYYHNTRRPKIGSMLDWYCSYGEGIVQSDYEKYKESKLNGTQQK